MNCSKLWLEMLISLRRSLYCFFCDSGQEAKTPIFSRDVDICLSSFVLTLIFSIKSFVILLKNSLIFLPHNFNYIPIIYLNYNQLKKLINYNFHIRSLLFMCQHKNLLCEKFSKINVT